MTNAIHTTDIEVSILRSSDLVSADVRDRRPQCITLFDDLTPGQRDRLAEDAWRIGLHAIHNDRSDGLQKDLHLRDRVPCGRFPEQLPEVVSHSMRGLHAKLATESGVTSHVVAAALGHTSFAVTARHYVGADVTRTSVNRRTLRVLRGPGRAVTRTASEFTAPAKEERAPEVGAAKSKQIA